MKKIVKLLPAALGLLTLTGCNSDDIFSDKDTLDLSGKTVVAVTDGDDVFTRAYKNEAIGGTVYVDGDKIRMYDSNLQKYDNFEFIGSEDGNYFALGEGVESNVKVKEDGTQDYAYALFGSDNVISYAGWNGAPLALVKITDTYKYDETEDQDGVAVYKSILPTFGIVRTVEKNGALRNNGKHYGTTQYTLVGRAKVTFSYGAGTGAKRVRVTSLKFNEGKSEVDFNELGNEKRQQTKLGEDIFAEEGAKALAGWFEAVLTDEPNATRTDFGLREIQEEAEGAVEPAKGTSITVSVDEGKMDKYTNVIFFPIAPGDYDMLLFEYSTASSGDGDWNYIGHRCGTVVRSDKIGDGDDPTDLTVSAEIKINDESLIPGKNHILNGTTNKGLQTYLEEYAKLGKSLEITVNGSINVGAANTIENYRELTVPALSEDITLNIKGQITGEGNTLTIKGGGGKGKLTINYEAQKDIEAKIVVNVANDFELKGKYAEEITVENVGNLTLNGEFAKAVTSPEGMTGNIAVSGKYMAGAVLSTTGNITVGNVNDDTMKGADKKLDLTAKKIIIEGNVYTLETAGETILTGSVNHSWAHSGGDLTVSGKASGGTLTVKDGSVTIEEGGSVATLTLNAGATSATINGKVGSTLTTNGVTVEINGVTVKNLKVNAPVVGNGIVLNAGTIETLSGYTGEDAAKTTVKSTGTADIKTVSDGDNFEFTSEIDGDTEAVEVAALNKTVNIYTGAQLLGLDLTDVENVKLHTNVTAKDVVWTPLAIASSLNFDGGNNTISGLAIDAKTDKAGFFSSFTGSGVTVKVNDLSLTYSSITSTARKVGGLVGDISNGATAEITNVSVTAESITGSNCVGGLVGNTDGGKNAVTVKINSSSVNAGKIAGTYYVGGMIGVLNAADVTIAKATGEDAANNIVDVEKFELKDTPATKYAGTFGMLAGGIYDGTSKFTASDFTATNVIKGDENDKLGFAGQTDTFSGTVKRFTGSDANEIGFSKSAAEGNVKINDTTYLISSLDNNAKSATTVNWFGKIVKE